MCYTLDIDEIRADSKRYWPSRVSNPETQFESINNSLSRRILELNFHMD